MVSGGKGTIKFTNFIHLENFIKRQKNQVYEKKFQEKKNDIFKKQCIFAAFLIDKITKSIL